MRLNCLYNCLNPDQFRELTSFPRFHINLGGKETKGKKGEIRGRGERDREHGEKSFSHIFFFSPVVYKAEYFLCTSGIGAPFKKLAFNLHLLRVHFNDSIPLN